MERKSLIDLNEEHIVFCSDSIVERSVEGRREVWYRIDGTSEYERKLSYPEGMDDEQETEYQDSHYRLN